MSHRAVDRTVGFGTEEVNACYGDVTTVEHPFRHTPPHVLDGSARIGLSMTKEWKSRLLEGTLELSGESETLFVYVVIPALCIIGLYILGTLFYQFMVDAHPAGASAASDFLSIDPDRWFPRA
jgi:hypothetical protein